MALTIPLDQNAGKKIAKELLRPFKSIKRFWSQLGSNLDITTNLQFRTEGGRAGERWAPLTERTLASRKKLGQGRKILFRTGEFFRSFKTMRTTEKKLTYGTSHSLAEKIMEIKNRQVLYVTDQDANRYASMFRNFYLKNLRF